MSKKSLHVKIDEMKTASGFIKNLELSFGKIVTESDWTEPMGPTPFPSVTTLREWDRKLLQRYKPFYLPYCDVCCLCTFGKCDLTAGKRGACGIDMANQQSRIVLLAACIGASAHATHARHLLEYLIKKHGEKHPINIGGLNVEVEAPIIRLVCGIKPKTLGDLEQVIEYTESQITQLLNATLTGQEGNNYDFESKVFHAGTMDHLGLEVGDLAQISSFDFPKGDPDAPLAELGFGTVDVTKPVILVIGHNVPPAIGIIDYLSANGLGDAVEVCGICCTSHDLVRRNAKAKIVGPISWQMRFVRSGVPDVIVVDEQCVRADILQEAQKIRTPVIASSETICLGLPDRTRDAAEDIVKDLASGKTPGALILNAEKVGEVASRLAMAVAPSRSQLKALPDESEIVEGSKKCIKCNECVRACPNLLPVMDATQEATKGNLSEFSSLYSSCVGCLRCESACPVKLPLHSYIVKSAEKQTKEERYKMRVGRGAIQDVEIRNVGNPIVLGEIPGVIAFVGCSNYDHGGEVVAEMVSEFAKRRFIVVTSGCSAMSAALSKDEDGKTPYEVYGGAFDAGGIVNVGSCVSNAHIAGAAIKIASIFAKRNLRANYEEIADYIYNRIGAVGVSWGAMSQKAAAIAAGFWRLGVPVVVGPKGIKYRRMLLGRADHEEDWYVHDARTGDRVYVGPAPEHLFYTAETKEEAMVMIAKLCLRPNDTTKGRAIKLTHYVDLHRRLYGVMPQDVHLFVRTLADIPVTMKDDTIKILEEKQWKESVIPDPTLLQRMIRKRKE